jgi:two-component system phosphate regulon response regulator PhoB
VLFLVGHRSVERRLRPSLEQRYEVRVARLRRETLQHLDVEPPDLLLIDVSSLRFSVERLLDELDDYHVPLMTFLLLNKGTRLDQVPRANGFLRRPFSPRQLMRRLGRVLPEGPRETVEWQEFCLDIGNCFLIWRGQQVPLTPKQASLAFVFMESPNEVVSREELMKRVWGTDYMGDTRTLDVHIHWLRKSIEQLEAPFVIETERGVGYRLIACDA